MEPLKTDYRSILRLALPVSAGTFMQFLVVLTDNFFLSRTSDVALNGAGNAGLLYITLAMIGAGFSNTGQILIARRMGEGDQKEGFSLLSSGLVVVASVGLFLIFTVEIALYAGFSTVFRDADTGAVFSEFLSIRKWGYLPSFLMMMLNAFFMGTARSRILMWAMITTGSVNVLGDALLIEGYGFIPAMGARGAAWASLTAECTGLLVLTGHALRHHGRAVWASPQLQMEKLSDWVRLALPMIAQLTLTLGTWSMFFFLVEQVGVLELKVSHIVRNFFMLAFVVSQGVQQTTRTFVSGLIGAGRQSELHGVMRRLFVVNLCGILLMTHGGIFYPSVLVSPFFDEPEGAAAAAQTLPVIFLAMLIYSGSSVLLSTIQGSGHTRPALIIELSSLVVYTTLAVYVTLIHPQPVWRIWWVEWSYFSGLGLGSVLFLLRWDWKSKVL